MQYFEIERPQFPIRFPEQKVYFIHIKYDQLRIKLQIECSKVTQNYIISSCSTKLATTTTRYFKNCLKTNLPHLYLFIFKQTCLSELDKPYFKLSIKISCRSQNYGVEPTFPEVSQWQNFVVHMEGVIYSWQSDSIGGDTSFRHPSLGGAMT